MIEKMTQRDQQLWNVFFQVEILQAGFTTFVTDEKMSKHTNNCTTITSFVSK